MLSGCSLLAIGAVAIGESRRQNSPEVVAARQADARNKLAQMQSIKKRADLGDAYAAIEVAKKCFEASYPCMVPEPEEVFRNYSERGYEIATYYHASIQLGMDVWASESMSAKEPFGAGASF